MNTALILTGHGRFASGMAAALELISGVQESFAAVDFDGDEAAYSENCAAALDTLSSCNQIIVLCDIRGGTPFRHWATASAGDNRLCVAYGVNLASVIEIALSRGLSDFGAKDIVAEALETLSEQTGIFKLTQFSGSDEDD